MALLPAALFVLFAKMTSYFQITGGLAAASLAESSICGWYGPLFGFLFCRTLGSAARCSPRTHESAEWEAQIILGKLFDFLSARVLFRLASDRVEATCTMWFEVYNEPSWIACWPKILASQVTKQMYNKRDCLTSVDDDYKTFRTTTFW